MRALCWTTLLSLRVGYAQLQIYAPKALAREFKEIHGMVYGTTATFGAPYYGKRVLGQLLFAESNGKDFCEHGDYTLPESQKLPVGEKFEGPKEMMKVLLVRRGGCTFVTKVRIAQEKGAHAVIVVDRNTSTAPGADIKKVVMSGDGWGDSVKIPSMMVSRLDGEKLIAFSQKQAVLVELAWDIPRDEVVTMDFWMSSGSREAALFMKKFKPLAAALGERLQFSPHYNIFSMEGDVADEDVRQLCIWNTTARPQTAHGASYPREYWQYVVDFNHRCTFQGADISHRFGKKCSEQVMTDLSIDVAAVQGCSKNYRVQLLREQLRGGKSRLALRLNSWRYSGPLDPLPVLKAVCGGFADPPAVCESSDGTGFPPADGVNFAKLVAALSVLASGLIAAFFFYKRHRTSSVRRVLREEVLLEA